MEEGKCLLDVINDPAALDDFLTSDRVGGSVTQQQIISAVYDGSNGQQQNLHAVENRLGQKGAGGAQLLLQVTQSTSPAQFAPTTAVQGGSANHLPHHLMLKSNQHIQNLLPGQPHVVVDQQQNVLHGTESGLGAYAQPSAVNANRIVIQSQAPTQVQTISVGGSQDVKFLPVNSTQQMYNGNQILHIQAQNAVAGASSFVKPTGNAVTLQQAVRPVAPGSQSVELVRMQSLQNIMVQNQSNATPPAVMQQQTVLVRAQINGQQVFLNLPISQLIQNQGKLVLPNISVGAGPLPESKLQPVLPMTSVQPHQQVPSIANTGSKVVMQNHVCSSQSNVPNVQTMGQFLIAAKKMQETAPSNTQTVPNLQQVAVSANTNSSLLYEQLKLPKQNYKHGSQNSHGVVLHNAIQGSQTSSLPVPGIDSAAGQPTSTVQHFPVSQQSGESVQQPLISTSAYYSAVSAQPTMVTSISAPSQNNTAVPQYAVIQPNSSPRHIPVTQPSPYMVLQSSPQTVMAPQSVGHYTTAQGQMSQGTNSQQVIMSQGQRLLFGSPQPQMIVQGKPGTQPNVVLQHGTQSAVQMLATDQISRIVNSDQHQSNLQSTQASVPQLAPKPVQGQKIQTIQLTPQNQQILQKVQVHIRGLLSIKDPTDTQKHRLQQLFNIQQTIINQGREAAIQSGIAQVQGQQAAVEPPVSMLDVKSSSSPKTNAIVSAVKPAETTSAKSHNSHLSNLLKRPVPIAIRPGTRPVTTTTSSVTVTTATSTMLQAPAQLSSVPAAGYSPVISFPNKLRVGNQIVQLPSAAQEQLRQFQEYLKTLPLEQQKALVEKQKQVLMNKGGPALANLVQLPGVKATATSSPAKHGSATSPSTSSAAETSKGSKRPGSATGRTPVLKSSRIQQQLTKDQNLCTRAARQTAQVPFRSVKDACKQLLRFHVFTSKLPASEDPGEMDETFEAVSSGLLAKKEQMLRQFQLMLLQESQRESPSWERVMLNRLLVRQERDELKADRTSADAGQYSVPEELVLKLDEIIKKQRVAAATTDATEMNSDSDKYGSSSAEDLDSSKAFNKLEVENSSDNDEERTAVKHDTPVIDDVYRSVSTTPPSSATSTADFDSSLVSPLNTFTTAGYSVSPCSSSLTYTGQTEIESIPKQSLVDSPTILPTSNSDVLMSSNLSQPNSESLNLPLSLESIIQQTLSDEDSFMDSDPYCFQSEVSADGALLVSEENGVADSPTKESVTELAEPGCLGGNNEAPTYVLTAADCRMQRSLNKVNSKSEACAKALAEDRCSDRKPSTDQPRVMEGAERAFTPDPQEYCDNVPSPNAVSRRRDILENALVEGENEYFALNGLPEDAYHTQEAGAGGDNEAEESMDESQAAVQTLLMTHPSLDIVDYAGDYADSSYDYAEYVDAKQEYTGAKEAVAAATTYDPDANRVVVVNG
ncbi:PREDICTED: chitinase-like protein PB1E7.04c, partial [Priapulus caudatus]|uniref:Chitinase-like protein PB1E7.04c n=1 Tax=Priapulus caudatus TaxID=37621 RepID=A0ABM1ERK3_PRICU